MYHSLHVVVGMCRLIEIIWFNVPTLQLCPGLCMCVCLTDCVATNSAGESVSRYFSVMWCKVSKKKVFSTLT